MFLYTSSIAVGARIQVYYEVRMCQVCPKVATLYPFAFVLRNAR